MHTALFDEKKTHKTAIIKRRVIKDFVRSSLKTIETRQVLLISKNN